MADRAYHFPTLTGERERARDAKANESKARRARARAAARALPDEPRELVRLALAGDMRAARACLGLYELPFDPIQRRRNEQARERRARARAAREAQAAEERRAWLADATPWLR